MLLTRRERQKRQQEIQPLLEYSWEALGAMATGYISAHTKPLDISEVCAPGKLFSCGPESKGHLEGVSIVLELSRGHRLKGSLGGFVCLIMQAW